MKKLLLIVVLGIVLSHSALADVGIVVDFPSGETKTDCIRTQRSLSAFDALERSRFDVLWSGSGRLVCSLDGVGSERGGGFCAPGGWAFYSNAGSGWSLRSGGLDSFAVSDGSLVGLAFGSSSLSDFDFGDVCRDYLVIDRVEVEVDGDGEVLAPNGRFVANPGKTLDFEVKVANPETRDPVELRNVEVGLRIRDLDVFEDDAAENLDAGDSDVVSLEVEIGDKEDEGVYEVLVSVEASGRDGKVYSESKTYFLKLEREDHKLVIGDVSFLRRAVSCGGTRLLSVEVENQGKKNERDASVVVSSPSVGFSSVKESVEVDEGDVETVMSTVSFSKSSGSGQYAVMVEAYDSTGRLNDYERVSLDYEGCAAASAGGARVQGPKVFEGAGEIDLSAFSQQAGGQVGVQPEGSGGVSESSLLPAGWFSDGNVVLGFLVVYSLFVFLVIAVASQK